MKILLSAFACDPQRGSEPGVGWNWATQLVALGHDVWVLTTSNARASIEKTCLNGANSKDGSINFIYHDAPFPPPRLRNTILGFHLYYITWQISVLSLARSLDRRIKFDYVQHITYGVHRYPSVLALLEVPFIFGPVGGGERAPFRMRRGLRAKSWLFELGRDISNVVGLLNPLLHVMCRRAALIACKTQQTIDAFPRYARRKCFLAVEIGASGVLEKPKTRNERCFKVLFVGRLHYVKGLHLAVRAFAAAAPEIANTTFTIIGEGPEESALRSLARSLEIDSKINWTRWMDRSELLRKYEDYDVLLFPSLHDSSGNAVLEALSNAVPVVCLDLGGPAALVTEGCGRIVSTKAQSEESVCRDLAMSLVEIADDPELHSRLRNGALERAREFSLPETIRRVYATAAASVERGLA